MKKSKIKKALIFYLVISALILYLSKSYVDKEEEKLLTQKYSTISKRLKESASNLIEDKKNATLAFAISTSNDKQITSALKKQ